MEGRLPCSGRMREEIGRGGVNVTLLSAFGSLHLLFRYRYIVIGAKTTTSPAQAASNQPIWPINTVPDIRPRTAVTKCVIGLKTTAASSQRGIVFGSTKMLLANGRGNMISVLTHNTEFGVLSTRPRAVQIHERLNATTTTSATERRTPTTPPSGRKPSTSPSRRTITEARVSRAASPKRAPTMTDGRHTGSDRKRSATPLEMSVLRLYPV